MHYYNNFCSESIFLYSIYLIASKEGQSIQLESPLAGTYRDTFEDDNGKKKIELYILLNVIRFLTVHY